MHGVGDMTSRRGVIQLGIKSIISNCVIAISPNLAISFLARRCAHWDRYALWM